uniref:Myosin heavy chain, skeletal muscle (Fragments) n=1 Tax=Oryctolagus cuniculus TaxID=9986 RepID=Q7M2W0_RABIT
EKERIEAQNKPFDAKNSVFVAITGDKKKEEATSGKMQGTLED